MTEIWQYSVMFVLTEIRPNSVGLAPTEI